MGYKSLDLIITLRCLSTPPHGEDVVVLGMFDTLAPLPGGKSVKGIARTKGIVCKKVSYIRRYREQSQSNELTIGQSGLTL